MTLRSRIDLAATAALVLAGCAEPTDPDLT